MKSLIYTIDSSGKLAAYNPPAEFDIHQQEHRVHVISDVKTQEKYHVALILVETKTHEYTRAK